MAYNLSMEKKVAVITALVEGCSVNSTVRMTGVAKGTVLRLLQTVGTACAEYHDAAVRNVSARLVQVDEIWSFCYAKEKNATPEMWERSGYAGDVWTFTAIEADTKLILGWLCGRRDASCATDFLRDVASRLSNRIQLTTDGHRMYFLMPLAKRSTSPSWSRSMAIIPKHRSGTARQRSSGRPKQRARRKEIHSANEECDNLSMHSLIGLPKRSIERLG
jgi:hypothetical protein